MSAITFDGWAVVEIMGHRRRAGRVTIDEGPLVKIESPVFTAEGVAEPELYPEIYGKAAIFGLGPCSEEEARAFARRYVGDPRPTPVVVGPAQRALPYYDGDGEVPWEDGL